MDVVYNHVAGANQSNFDVLTPGYYFRYTEAGALSNGSGCGNETASEHFMMRKFMGSRPGSNAKSRCTPMSVSRPRFSLSRS